LKLNDPAEIELAAVDRKGALTQAPRLKLTISKDRLDPALTKQENGTLKYEKMVRTEVVRTESLDLDAKIQPFSLPTDQAGDFRLELTDEAGFKVFAVDFSVVGVNSKTLASSEEPDLHLTLKTNKLAPGQDLEFSLDAPYEGYGLVTVERDRVYAWTWFQTGPGSCVQTIHIPETFAGSAYLTVNFVRSLNSNDVYSQPLSYATKAFQSIAPSSQIHLVLSAPKQAKPGEKGVFHLKADRDCSVVLFAVDRGLLQISDYQTPDPLGWTYRKRLLEVETRQILDSLLPEYSKLKHSAMGGGDEHIEKQLNPFTRVVEKPVVYWSGIVRVGPQGHDFTYIIPDFFDGGLQVMAVAVTPDATGSTDANCPVHGPIIITPQTPAFAAPGDEFLASASLTNALDAPMDSQVHVEVEGGLTLLDNSTQTIQLIPGQTKVLRFRARATEKLGNAVVRFVAQTSTDSVRRQRTLSVRPSTAFSIHIDSGKLSSGSQEVALSPLVYDQYANRSVSFSATPLTLVNGLRAYLDSYPYDCSEQLTSRAFANLSLATLPGSGLTRDKLNSVLQGYFSKIATRQSNDGAFGYWSPDDASKLDPLSVYVLEFLTDAHLAGIKVPTELDNAGLTYLKSVAGQQPSSLPEAEVIAKAIYLLTRREQVTTNQIINLRDTLDRDYPGGWQDSLTGVYLAGSAGLLLKDHEANDWIAHYHLHAAPTSDTLFSTLKSDAEYLLILARHFPARFQALSGEELERVFRPLLVGDYNTISAAECTRVLAAAQSLLPKNNLSLKVSEWSSTWHDLSPAANGLTKISPNSVKLRIQSNGTNGYYQVIVQGFPKNLEPTTSGLEIQRELLDNKGQSLTHFRVGDDAIVRLRIRSTTGSNVEHVAILDLFSAGYEPVREKGGDVKVVSRYFDHDDIRDDRAIFYLTVTPEAADLTYRVKMTSSGQFTLPPITAHSMYNLKVQAVGPTGKIFVE
jgi:uncharacterized protein YfaS (alpha-2-macroglobulin family)